MVSRSKPTVLMTVLPLMVLSACRPPVTPIPFESDAILRGTWTGTETLADGTAGRTITMNLSANYISLNEYSVSGTGQLGSQEVLLTGKVDSGHSVEFLAPQTVPINPSMAILHLAQSGGTVGSLFCSMGFKGNGVADGVEWACNFIENNPRGFLLKKVNL